MGRGGVGGGNGFFWLTSSLRGMGENIFYQLFLRHLKMLFLISSYFYAMPPRFFWFPAHLPPLKAAKRTVEVRVFLKPFFSQMPGCCDYFYLGPGKYRHLAFDWLGPFLSLIYSVYPAHQIIYGAGYFPPKKISALKKLVHTTQILLTSGRQQFWTQMIQNLKTMFNIVKK